jgi:sialate O-acetylesterase
MNFTSTAAAIALVAASACAVPTLPAIFSDNMVLQRTTHAPVWGKAEPGEKVVVALGDAKQPLASATATADAEGRWRVMLDTSKVSDEATTLHVAGTENIAIRNVLVGQVWLCSGQSNMEWNVANSNDAAGQIAQADRPQIREFYIPHTASAQPTEELTGEWRVASPETVGRFSAVGYYFGRELNDQLKTPVGLIHSSWGGTAAELWTDHASLRSIGDFNGALDALEIARTHPERAEAWFNEEMGRWMKRIGLDNEPGETAPQAEAGLDDSTWGESDVPGSIHEIEPDLDGVVWLRRVVEIENPVGEARIDLGPIDDWDTTYINGKRVGRTGRETADAWNKKRSYRIPEGLLKPGRNVIAVRVVDYLLGGGIGGDAGDSVLVVGDRRYPLAGKWRHNLEIRFNTEQKQLGYQVPIRPDRSDQVPGRLYNAMLHPLRTYAIAGAIWYQGEANVGREQQYRKLLPAMIGGWRRIWDQQGESLHRAEGGRDFPFYIVQLANFLEYRADARYESNWAALRDAQTFTARTVPNTGLALAIDIGDAHDIHPRNKLDVGRRLALLALRDAYGKPVIASGPQFSGITIEGSRVLVKFEGTAEGLKVRTPSLPRDQSGELRQLMSFDTPVRGFAVRGKDGKWSWAKARIIDPTTVEVISDDVTEPVDVRYAWADNPVANLYNSADLPAVPFRSDDPQYKQ